MQQHRLVRWVSMGFLAAAVACSGGDDGTSSKIDSGVGKDDATLGDADTASDAAATPNDGGDSPDRDAGAARDAHTDDAGTIAGSLSPGTYVEIGSTRISIGERFDAVTQKLGRGTRDSATGSRLYEWTVANQIPLQIWFANTDLDDDDQAPRDVDGSDRALWIAVGAPFAGKTAEGIGLGSSRTEVERAYGAAPHPVAVGTGTGTIERYFTRGIALAYAAGFAIGVTIARAYPMDPSGAIDLVDRELSLPSRNFNAEGESRDDVVAAFGEPDGEGNVTLGGVPIPTMSYAFFGLEIYLSPFGSPQTMFMSVHAPYFGTVDGAHGIGSARSDFEPVLAADFEDGVDSSVATLVCYAGKSGGASIGVTYARDGEHEVTSITMPLLQCPQ